MKKYISMFLIGALLVSGCASMNQTGKGSLIGAGAGAAVGAGLGAIFGKDGKSGNIAKILKQSADFLVKQGSIKSAPDMAVFKENATGEFIVRALNE